MKAFLYVAVVATALLFTPNSTTAQDAEGLFVTVSIGALTYSNEFPSSEDPSVIYPTPVDVGYVGRLGFQASLSNPRFRWGLEFDYSSTQMAVDDPRYLALCEYYDGPAQSGRGCTEWPSSDLYGVAFSFQSIFGNMQARVQPYGTVGVGWMGLRNLGDPDNIGPKLDLAIGLAFTPFASGLIALAIEPRYTYFLGTSDLYDLSHLSLAVVTRIQLTRRRDKTL